MSAVPKVVSDTRPAFRPEADLVRRALVRAGLETPMVGNDLSGADKIARITASMIQVLETLGLDLEDDSLAETPERIARMYVDEIFSGLDYSRFPKISAIENKMGVDEMIRVNDISLVSTCEHHFVTIDGTASVAYIPRDKVIGLSKINRIVMFFARRPQVQERLTRQVMVALQALLDTDDVAVSIDAVHYCVKARGVMDETSHTCTSALGGVFKRERQARNEFLWRGNA